MTRIFSPSALVLKEPTVGWRELADSEGKNKPLTHKCPPVVPMDSKNTKYDVKCN